ncbi:MAG TPA: hypothetical protein VL588_10115, partial [Bdellovibrionota bacterium]|nr:hypothetical protein [Bdellovibrionota bacterium]
MSSRAYTSALRTALVAAICLGGAFQAGKMLYMDYTRPVGEGDGPAVASVEWQSSQVRRKPPSSYLWGGVQTDDPLYRRDSVRTGADSAARIKLKSGTTLELGENSLIVLEDSEDLSFNTLKGSLVVRKPSGATRVTVDAEGKKTATQLQVSLVEPEPGTSFAVAPGQRFQVRLKWKRWGDSPGKSRLQVASNSSFSRVVKDLAPEGESTEMVLDLPAGEYYWRILEAGAGAKAAGDTSRFSVNELSPPKLLSPADNEVSEIAGDEGSVQLRWVPTEGGHAVRLELTAADDPGFGHARTVEVDGRTGFATVDDLKEGQYLWRTQASLGDLKVPGAPRHFALKKSLHLKVALASPEDGAALEWRPRLRFAWSTTVLDKLAYRLRIRKAGENTKYLLEQELGAPAFAWDDPVDGPLEWQVSALAEGKDVGDSEWRPFSVRRGDPLALLEPADQAVIRYWGETPDTRLSWNPDRAVEKDGLRYHLEVSPQFRFERDVKTADLQKHEIQFSTLGLPPGRYFWRVTVLDESGKVVKASETRSFDQGVHPLLPAPVAVTPREGEKFEQLDQERKTVLHWEKVADARGYRVMLSRADTADKSRQDFQAEGDSLELPALKQEGEYYWSVSAVDPLGRVGEASPPRRFSISWGGQLAAPLVKAPEPGEVDFKWDAVENAVRYEVEVGRIDETPKSVPVDGRSWEGSEEKHSPGLYRVRVRAADRFGRGGAWSAPQAMVVFASPPQPVSPTDGAKVQTYFDGSDVTLQWVPRKGADAYLVDVFSGGLLV